MNPRAARIAARVALLAGSCLPSASAEGEWGLEWDAPPECPRASDVRRAIAEHLPTEAAEIRGRVLIEAVARRYRARLTLGGDALGTREIEADNCRSMTRAVALIIAISVDPSAAVALSDRLSFDEVDEAAPSVDPARPVESELAGSAPPSAKAPGSPRSALFQLGAGVGFDAGWIPGLVAVGHAEAELVTPWMRLAVDGGWPLERTLPGPSETTVSVDAPTIGARVCRSLWAEAPLFVCGRARLAFVSAVALPSATAERGTTLAALLEPGGLFEIPLGAGWRVSTVAFFSVPTEAHDFVVLAGDGATELPAFRLGLGASGAITLAHRFE